MSAPDRHPVLSFLSAFFWVFVYLLSWVQALAAFITLTIPTYIYAILSYSMTLTLNFWSFAIIFAASAVALNYWIRFRYLNVYTQLKEVPLTKPDTQELHPDVNTAATPPVFHNYLDEFLQAVRVFGFLEKPVFHELARHLQTRRLIAGDSLSLDQDKSFYCVVDGTVQVFAPMSNHSAPRPRGGAWDNEDMNGFELMNEVGAGGTLSSLFTILNLFTEDIKIGGGNQGEEGEEVEDEDVSHFELNEMGTRERSPSASSSGSTVHAREREPPPPSGASPMPTGMRSPPMGVRSPSTFSQTSTATGSRRPRARRMSSFRTDVHHGTVARATVDTTLAVIPAEAFRRLTKKFPKATAHIVQVIMTRFSRVTFNAAHGYLGLTSEVLRTEKAINDIACHPLPRSFYEGGGMQQLRQRFDAAGSSESGDDYFGRRAPSSSDSTLTAVSSQRTAFSHVTHAKVLSESPKQAAHLADAPPAVMPTPGPPRSLVHAGDLFSSTPSGEIYRPRMSLSTPHVQPRRANTPAADPPLVAPAEDEFDLRQAVMDCIAVSIGLQPQPLSGGASVDASPAVVPTDWAKAGVINSFGSLSLLEMSDDHSSSAGGASSGTNGNGHVTGFDNEVEILFFSAGSHLARAGEKDTGLFYVIEGFLDIVLPDADTPSKAVERGWSQHVAVNSLYEDDARGTFTGTTLFTVKPGGIAGYLASLSNTASYVGIVAKTDTYVGYLPHNALERLLEKQPIVLLTLAKRLISLLSPLVLQIDASLEWMQVNASQVLWRTGDDSDSFYIVINGRLRTIMENENGGVNIVAEHGQGDTTGEIDVITRTPRRNTTHAIRDTELIRMPRTLFNAISVRNPQTTAQILRMIASRVRSEVDSSSAKSNPSSEVRRTNSNLKTVAVLPVTRSIPIDAFARKLYTALEGIGASTVLLNQAAVSTKLGRYAFTRMGKLKTAAWLADQEQRFKIVLYVADAAVTSSWTQTCIRQADFVMLVGMGDDPSIGEYERLLLSLKTTARKELVLLHPDRSVAPGSTREWLKNRPWVHQHIHVELPGLKLPVSKTTVASTQDPAAVAALKNLKDIVQSEIQKYRGARNGARPRRQPHMNDFARLARRICGKSIGLVLGGGGARGIAHLGLIRAMEEYGIPIDHVGGTSIGSFIGGLYSREGDIISSSGRAKQFSARMGNIWRMLSDVTYPIVAYTTGHEFNRSLYKAFYDLHIEDMWLPYFCNTANITTSNMDLHDTGYAWRYIRASMTLVGLLPPLCDRGNMLVDGGYSERLRTPPVVKAMFDTGASIVFASDVGAIDDNSPRNFGDSVSGWWLFINRWNPFSNARTVPAITEIQSRLAYVSSVRTLEEAKNMDGCLYMAMPVQEYGTLQFGKFEEIQEKGYNEALKLLDKWDEEGRLPSLYIDGREPMVKSRRRGLAVRRNSI
ncbi:patatin-domain-containing protein [Vararia minispora EC-137]|uniref:Patatin-domain-containing protein n=1 Tax=Vararia minispora EC-137 TaxID=1314806 RepID=A0ACB8QHJ1_9AGAM|nr:patatin-domain-containing protein [Vararia minispora EC-137]